MSMMIAEMLVNTASPLLFLSPDITTFFPLATFLLLLASFLLFYRWDGLWTAVAVRLADLQPS